MSDPRKKGLEAKKSHEPLSPTYTEGKDEESLFIGKAFSNFPVEKLLSEAKFELLVGNFKQIVAAVNLKTDIEDAEIINTRIKQALDRWLKFAILFSFNAMLDRQGYIQTRRLAPLGWKGGTSIYKQENIQILMISFVKTLLQQVIKVGFASDENLSSNMKDLFGYVGNYLSKKLPEMIKAKHKTRPIKSNKDYIDFILKEFVQTLERERKPKDYRLMGSLLELPIEKLSLSDFAKSLDIIKANCIPEGFLMKIITKYREIIELSLLKKQAKTQEPKSPTNRGFFSGKADETNKNTPEGEQKTKAAKGKR